MPVISMKNAPELTREDVRNLLIPQLQRASVVLAAGPGLTISSPTGDPVRIPRVASMGEAAWHAENEQITESDMDPDEVVLLPTVLKSLKVLSRFSQELARHAVVPIGSALQTQLVGKVSKAWDGEALDGAGTPDGNGNRSVIGIQNITGAQTGTWQTTPTAVEVTDLSFDAIQKLLTAELTDHSKVVWFMRPADYIAISKAKDADTRPLLQPDPTRPGARTLQGFPIFVTSKLAAGKCLLVDMAQIVVAIDQNISVQLLSERYADWDQLAVKVTMRMDLGALHPEGIVVLTDALP